MAVKLIVVCLTLSCIFLCVLGGEVKGELKITEEQYAQFKGTDPTKYCGCKQSMEKFCNAIIKLGVDKPPEGPFKKGYPECQDADIKLEKNCGGGTTKKTNVIVCGWEKDNGYYVYGKGQTKNNVMNYKIDDKGVCHFWAQFPYTGN